MWRKRQKLDFLTNPKIDWKSIDADVRHSWLVPENADEYGSMQGLGTVFSLRTLGINTARNEVAYDWQHAHLQDRITMFIAAYNAEVYRHKAEAIAGWPDNIKWSEGLKLNVRRGNFAQFDEHKIVTAAFRPFTKKLLYFDRILNERVYQWPKVSGRAIWVKAGEAWPFFILNVRCHLRSASTRRISMLPAFLCQRLCRRPISAALPP